MYASTKLILTLVRILGNYITYSGVSLVKERWKQTERSILLALVPPPLTFSNQMFNKSSDYAKSINLFTPCRAFLCPSDL